MSGFCAGALFGRFNFTCGSNSSSPNNRIILCSRLYFYVMHLTYISTAVNILCVTLIRIGVKIFVWRLRKEKKNTLKLRVHFADAQLQGELFIYNKYIYLRESVGVRCFIFGMCDFVSLTSRYSGYRISGRCNYIHRLEE